MTKYYNSDGSYTAYSTDGKELLSKSGEQIGYFLNGFLYDTKGKAIGHVKGSLILDKSGQTLYYSA